MKILIADDDRVTLTILETSLKKWGHEVVKASDGEEAWAAFQEHDISFVISDWMMPGCDGMELCRRIRQSPRGEYAYFIVQSAKGERQDIVQALDEGADDFLRKPLKLDELKARIGAGLRISKLQSDLNAQLKKISKANDQMRRDIEAAADIQRSLLPEKPPEIPRLKFCWHYEPCEQVGGDTMNVFRLDERTVAVYVLDVSGHGVPAALLAVTLSRLLSPASDSSALLKRVIGAPPNYEIASPTQVADDLNIRFPMNLDLLQYFTLLYGYIDLETLAFRYIQAGHPNPIVCHTDGEECESDRGNAPIGFFPEEKYHEKTIQLKPGSRVLFYSDGATEACDADNEYYGEDRLFKKFSETAEMDLSDALSDVRQALRSWTGKKSLKDDLTLLAMQIDPE